MLNEKRLNLMKQGSILVNISRGTVIDEQALVKVIKTGKFRGCLLYTSLLRRLFRGQSCVY